MADSLGSRYIAAWNSHDGGQVASFMADDVDFEDVTMGVQLRGPKEVEAFAFDFGESFSSDYRFTLVTELATDTTLAAEWTVSGTHDRGSPQLPATGKPFTIRGVTIARLRDGKIAYNRDYWDMAGFLVEVGILPPPGG
jgi:steroid delta-isomerase-like uncharacterized protein